MEYRKEPIKGYGEYQIDTNGVVYRKDGKIKSYVICKLGYKDVSLMDKNHKMRTFRVHRLVAIQFIPNPNNYPVVNHIDGNPLNNNVENLEWCSYQYNSQHAVWVLKRGNTKEIIGRDKRTGEIIYRFESLASAGRHFESITGVHFEYIKNSIWRALSGLRKSYHDCVWEYTNEE